MTIVLQTGLPERRVAEHRLEVGEADERTVEEPEERQVVLEGDDVAQQRQVVEQQKYRTPGT